MKRSFTSSFVIALTIVSLYMYGFSFSLVLMEVSLLRPHRLVSFILS